MTSALKRKRAMNAPEFQRLARACLASAMEAKNDAERKVFLETANAWNQAALRSDDTYRILEAKGLVRVTPMLAA